MPSRYNPLVLSDSEKIQKSIKYIIFISKHVSNEKQHLRRIMRSIPSEIVDIKVAIKQINLMKKELEKIILGNQLEIKTKDLAYKMNGSSNNPKEEVLAIWMKMYSDRC